MATPASYLNPLQRGQVLVPGVPVLAAGVERYPIPGSGSRAVEVVAGDEFTLVDEEGLQRAEIVMFAPDGRSDAGLFGGSSAKPALGLQQTLAGSDASGKRVLQAL